MQLSAKRIRLFLCAVLVSAGLASLWLYRTSGESEGGGRTAVASESVDVPEAGEESEEEAVAEEAGDSSGSSTSGRREEDREEAGASVDRKKEVPGAEDPRPIEDYPVLTREDRVDMEGRPAPHIPRGRHERRVLDTHVDREVARDNPEPIRPFGQAIPARENSPFAHDRFSKSAVEVGMSHRLFHQAAAGERHRMVVPLTENEEVVVDLEKVVERGPHTFSFVGTVEEHPDSVAVLVYNEGNVTGDVSLYGDDTLDSRHFGFQAMEDGLVAVRELDAAAVHAEECGVCAEVHGDEVLHDPTDPLVTGEILSDEPMGDEAEHIVDVVVGYGREARIADGGVAAIEGRIIASVDRMNISFANSLVSNTELVLLGMVEDPDYVFKGTDAGSMSDELNDLNNPGNGRLDSVSSLRSDLGADLNVFIISDADGSAGLAYRPGSASITARPYMSNTALTFVHELGHNFGSKHSWGDTEGSDSNTTGYNYGWRLKSGNTKRRSVMAYDWTWQRTMHFSNPAVTHPSLGVSTGAVDGYDATGDDTTDSRYVSGGYVGGVGPGFDGSHPDLGARNADYLFENAGSRASLRTRAALGVTRPASGETVPFGEPYLIEWVGGFYDDTVDLELLKGGVLVESLATGVSNGERVSEWSPAGLAEGEDYQIRLTLNGGEEVAVSDPFSMNPDYPRVVDTFVSQRGIAEPGLTEVSVSFNRSMDPASFSEGQDVSRFVGPNGGDLSGSFTGFTWSEENTRLTFAFSALNDPGFYRIDFGPDILDERGFAMNQNGNELPGETDDGFGFSFQVGELSGESETRTLFETDFATNPGFTLNTGWAIGPPDQAAVGGPGQAATGDNVLGTYLSGNYPAGVQTDVVSPVFDFTGATNVTVHFKRWLGLARSGSGYNVEQDDGTMHFSVDGGPWYQVFAHRFGDIDDGGWTDVSYVLWDEKVDGQSHVRLRFRLESETAASYGWNIDDFSITADFADGFNPPPAPKVVGHFPDGAAIATPSAVWIDFDQPMDTASFSLSDLVSFDGPSGALTATGFAWIGDNRLRIDFDPVTEEGNYLLTLGTGILSVEGDALAASYAAGFEYGVFDPPVIVTSSIPMAHEGEPYSVLLEAGSPDGLALDLTVTGRPAWLSFTDNGDGSGLLSGTPPEDVAGPFSLTFTADDTANTVQANYTLDLNRQPVVTVEKPSQQEIAIPGGVLLLVEGAVSDDGEPADTLTQGWSVVSAPPEATVSFDPVDSLQTAIDFDTAGDYELRFTADDGVLQTVYDLSVEAGVAFGGAGNNAVIPTENLAVHLPLDESSGSVAADNSGNGREALLQGSPVWQPDGGPRGGALEFTGSGQYGEVQNSAGLNDHQQMSWSFWIQPAENNGDVRGILGKRLGTTSGRDWSFFLWNSNELTVDIGSSRHGISTIPAGTWKHVTVVFDGTLSESERLKVYYDGQLEATKSESASSIAANTAPVQLGILEDNSGNFRGRMSEVLIYHGRALTDEDVSGIFEGGPGNIGPLVNAGSDQTVTANQLFPLNGVVSDDGLPEYPGEVITQWVQIDGPTPASFSDATLPASNVTLDGTGAYTLRLTGDDGEVKTAHDVTLEVNAGTSPGSIAFGGSEFVFDANAGTVTVPVVRSGGTDGAVSVQVNHLDGSAQAGTHFDPVAQTLQWADGQSGEQSVTLTLAAQPALAGDLDFTLSLSGVTGEASLGSPQQTSVTLTGPGEAVDVPFDNHNSYGQVQVVTESDGSKTLTLTASGDTNPWDSAFRWPIAEPLANGEILWLRIVGYASSVPGEETGEMRVPTLVELQQSPYTRYLEGSMRFGPQSREQILIGEMTEDLAADTAYVNMHLGGLEGTLHIESVELVRYPPGTDPADLPRSPMVWEGMEPDAAWRADAESAIQTHRTDDLRIRVLDAEGNPVQGATVTARQQTHAFAFGTAVNNRPMLDPGYADGPTYRQKLVENFEWATPENSLKWQAEDWGNWEAGKTTADQGQATVDKIVELGLIPRGHVLLWPSYDNSPSDLVGLDNAALAAEIETRVRSMSAQYAGTLPEWDALNEVYSNHDFPDLLGNQLLEDVFTWARAEDPDARFFINDYNILTNGNLNTDHKDAYYSLISSLQTSGVPLGGIGMQGHFGGTMPGVSEMQATLDRFAAFGLPIRITEYDHDILDEEAQAGYLRDVLTLTFAHPSVDGFFVWGFWDGRHWKDNAPFYREDWSEKPALAVWRQLVYQDWWTGEVHLETDAQGWVTLPAAFHGDYRIEVTGYESLDVSHVPGQTEYVLTPPEPFQTWLADNGMDASTDPDAEEPATGLTYHDLYTMGAALSEGQWQGVLTSGPVQMDGTGEGTVSFDAQTGRRYFLQTSPSLTTPDWQDVAGQSVEQEGAQSFTLPATDGEGFYRIRVEVVE